MSNIKKNYYEKLETVVVKARESAGFHSDEIVSLEKFFKVAEDLVRNECPEFLATYQEINKYINMYIDEEKKLAECERIYAEDLNDIIARNVVLSKSKEAVDAKRIQFNKQKSEIEKLRSRLADDLSNKNGANQTKIKNDLQKAESECATSKQELIGRLTYLAQSKKRDDLYRARKLRSSFNTLSTVTTNCLTNEIELLERIKNLCDIQPETLDQILADPFHVDTHKTNVAPSRQTVQYSVPPGVPSAPATTPAPIPVTTPEVQNNYNQQASYIENTQVETKHEIETKIETQPVVQQNQNDYYQQQENAHQIGFISAGDNDNSNPFADDSNPFASTN